MRIMRYRKLSKNMILSIALSTNLFAPVFAQSQSPDPNQFLPDPVSESQSQESDQPNAESKDSRRHKQNHQVKPLQGGIEQSEITGGAEDTILEGGAGDSNWQMDAQQGMQDRGQPLQGNATDTTLSGSASDDPDDNNQELAIEWDRWRNNLIQAIQANTIKNINVHNNIHFVWDPRTQMMQSRYPNGTSVWYFLNVLPNRKIINVRLTQNSQFPSYDQAVIQAIYALSGNKILEYPRGSRRQIVAQEANVSTAAQTTIQNFNFGDVERQQY